MREHGAPTHHTGDLEESKAIWFDAGLRDLPEMMAADRRMNLMFNEVHAASKLRYNVYHVR